MAHERKGLGSVDATQKGTLMEVSCCALAHLTDDSTLTDAEIRVTSSPGMG